MQPRRVPHVPRAEPCAALTGTRRTGPCGAGDRWPLFRRCRDGTGWEEPVQLSPGRAQAHPGGPGLQASDSSRARIGIWGLAGPRSISGPA